MIRNKRGQALTWPDELTAEVKRLRSDGYSWTHIAQTIKNGHPEIGETESQVLRKARHIVKPQKTERADKSTKRYNADGSVESVCLIDLWNKDDITPDEILVFHHLDPHKWEIVSCVNNIWNAQDKIGRVQMYQSKVSAKPRRIEITLDDIDAYFKGREYGKHGIMPMQYDASGETLEICLPDLHIGLLAWAQETGVDYDIHIARDSFMACLTDIEMRCKGRTFKRVYLVTLGDLLHIDNDSQATTKGTPQQADGRLAKIFDKALDMLTDGIDILAGIAPVEVVYLAGNHDRMMGYTLIKALSCAYKGLSFDTSPDPQKFRRIGCSLIGWTHGDMIHKNMGMWLQDRARAEYGLTRFAEVHAGHLHSTSRTEYRTTYQDGGVVVKHLPTVSNASAWEHQQGYPKGTRTMMCFVWHDTMGLRETWYSNL